MVPTSLKVMRKQLSITQNSSKLQNLEDGSASQKDSQATSAGRGRNEQVASTKKFQDIAQYPAVLQRLGQPALPN